jgi:hypothetical protein
LLLATVLGCRTDQVSAPSRAGAIPEAAAKVYPASQYKARVLIPGTNSLAADVNDANAIVGYVNGEGFWLPWGGSHRILARPGSSGANAVAITTHHGIGGAVIRNAVHFPAYWPDPHARPMELAGNGSVMDVNDRGEAVGHMEVKGIRRAFYWETATRSWVALPRYAKGADDFAWAINNDRLVVGTSSGYPVMWRQLNGSWTVYRINGIFPTDIDAGYGTVGYDGQGHATYGSPDHAGTFPTQWLATAWAVNNRGEAVGEDWNTATNQVLAWVADRFGSRTYLPLPPGSTQTSASARGINTCGLVVGFLGSTFASEAVMWDPGC